MLRYFSIKNKKWNNGRYKELGRMMLVEKWSERRDFLITMLISELNDPYFHYSAFY